MTASPNRRIAGRLAAVAAVMLAGSFAAVPFYNLFCRVTGYNGTPNVAEAPPGPARPEVMTIRFDANTAPGLPAEFRPVARKMEVRLDETGLAFYEFVNLSDHPITAAASFNVTPYAAGAYFSKIACFCFEKQTLAPGERIEMPVSFFVDPAILEDAEARDVREITLSYTMHPSDPPPAADAAGATGSTRLAKAAAQVEPAAIEN
ncbi:cytochrome c oxidase assembly protein [Amaricoccus sp.]|uniref:cytochrome c oxidase assembly protein n=1 Tax=Amaricoccus sp. TaxID=1872485 RepID=UPI001B40A607|nr:cytochrome c oxidase assembly protein [Amaricoccus sp.]MBP7001488.1 cytochrome c oxidase assembly protein [Amaricoccus sp.]